MCTLSLVKTRLEMGRARYIGACIRGGNGGLLPFQNEQWPTFRSTIYP